MPDLISEFEEPADMSLLSGEDDAETDEDKGQIPDGGEPEVDTGKADDTGIDTGDTGTDTGATDATGEEKPARSPQIPRERFDEVNTKYKDEKAARERLEAELAALRKGNVDVEPEADNGEKQPDGKVNIIDLEREYYNATMDGEEDRAIEIRAQINAELVKQAKAEVSQEIEEKQTAKERKAAEKAALDALEATAESVMERWPVLDIKNGGDKATVDKVVKWRDFLIMTEGLPMHEALEQAAENVLGASDIQPNRKTDARREAAVKRNLAESGQQPPASTGGIGNRATGVVIPEGQDAWEKTPAKDRERLLS